MGLQKSCGALDFNLGCSGYIYGLSLSKGLLLSSDAKNILLITLETYTKFLNKHDRSNRSIFGDGATTSLITNQFDSGSIQNFVFVTDGSGNENLIVKNGGIRNFKKNGINDFIGIDYYKNDNNLYIIDEKIFEFTTQSVPIPILIREVLKK